MSAAKLEVGNLQTGIFIFGASGYPQRASRFWKHLITLSSKVNFDGVEPFNKNKCPDTKDSDLWVPYYSSCSLNITIVGWKGPQFGYIYGVDLALYQFALLVQTYE